MIISAPAVKIINEYKVTVYFHVLIQVAIYKLQAMMTSCIIYRLMMSSWAVIGNGGSVKMINKCVYMLDNSYYVTTNLSRELEDMLHFMFH